LTIVVGREGKKKGKKEVGPHDTKIFDLFSYSLPSRRRREEGGGGGGKAANGNQNGAPSYEVFLSITSTISSAFSTRGEGGRKKGKGRESARRAFFFRCGIPYLSFYPEPTEKGGDYCFTPKWAIVLSRAEEKRRPVTRPRSKINQAITEGKRKRPRLLVLFASLRQVEERGEEGKK